MSSKLQVEDNPRASRRKTNATPYSKKDFAKIMNCSVDFLDSIENFTLNILGLDKTDFIGNIGCRYCGRWYKRKDDSEYSIWVGVFFDKNCNFELQVSFWVATPDSKNQGNINYQ